MKGGWLAEGYAKARQAALEDRRHKELVDSMKRIERLLKKVLKCVRKE